MSTLTANPESSSTTTYRSTPLVLLVIATAWQPYVWIYLAASNLALAAILTGLLYLSLSLWAVSEFRRFRSSLAGLRQELGREGGGAPAK